jgi:Dirigent-like protein
MKSIAKFTGFSGALAVCWALVVASVDPAGAAGPTTISVRESHKGAIFKTVDVAPKGKNETDVSPGDELVFSIPLVAGGKKIGRENGVCVITRAAAKKSPEYLCTSTYAFAHQGTLATSMNFKPSKKTNQGAIVGGTGVYAGARGTFTITNETEGDDKATFTLLE